MTKLPQNINFIFFLIFLLLLLMIPWNPPVWDCFSDPWDYLFQSKISLSDIEFYVPHKILGFYPRPFTIPLFYKIAQSLPDTIVQMQKLIFALSVFYIITSILQFCTKNLTKLFLIVSLYALMMWWNIAGWTIVLLSESLSISLLFCWIASFLFLLKKRDLLSFFLHLLITVLFSFTRDTWPYILVVFYLIFSIIVFFWDKRLIKKLIFLLCFSGCIFFVQQKTATIGNRYKLPLINTIVLRIIPNFDYTEWFTSHGMPEAKRLKDNFLGVNANNETRIKIYNLYNDTTYNTFFDWVISDGKSVYMKFLLTHPKYSFLVDESSFQLQRIFSYNLMYPGVERGFSKYVNTLFPLFEPFFVFILSLVLIYFFYKKKNIYFLLPITLILIMFFNVILTYNADTLEVERHLFITNIMVQFIGFLSMAIIIDNTDIITQTWNQLKNLKFSKVKKS